MSVLAHVAGDGGVPEMLKHHRGRPHRADRVGDALAGDVRAAHALEHVDGDGQRRRAVDGAGRLNCVCPGPTDTPLLDILPEKLRDA